MIPRNYMMFFDADDGGGDGGGESRGIDVFEGGGEQQAPEPQTQYEAPETPRREAPGPTVDAEQLAQKFGQVIGQHFRPPQREMTVEEAKKLMSVWEPTKEWLAKYDNLETREQAIAEQRDGLIRQTDTLMRYRMQEMMQQMEQQYAPALEMVRQQEARAGEWRFAQAFPQLNRQELRPLLFSVAQSYLANGSRFNSERELFTAIARGVESVIKVSNPQFSLESNGTTGAVPQGRRTGHTAGALPVTTPGAGGGGMRGPGPPKPRGLAIFDP
jgi:hypothetical protein